MGEASDGATALDLLEQQTPDVVVLDCRLPDACGYEIIERAQMRGVKARFVAYSAYEEYDDVMNILRAGAAGFVVKDESIENLLHALRAVARGGMWYSQRIAKKLAEWVHTPPQYAEQLTESEIRVLRLLTEAQSNREIATALGIAERTVRFHLQNVQDKLQLARREQVFLWALEHGYGKKRLREKQADYQTE